MKDNQPLAITMVTGSLSRQAGGLFNSVRMMSKNLAARGHVVHVIGIRDSDTDSDLSAWAPLNPIILDAKGPPSLGFAPALSRSIAATQPDIIHQHGIWKMLSYDVSQFAISHPIVVSPRGMLDPWALRNSGWKKTLAWYGWEKRNLSRAACIHALAPSEASSILDTLSGARVVTLPNAVDLPCSTSPIQRSQRRKVMLFLGRIHPKKGLAQLFRQWERLPSDLRASWRLMIAGPDEGGHRQELEALLDRLEMRGDVDFIGPVNGPEKDLTFRSADAFILPSFSEGLPMAVLEAWSYRLPVMMTEACNLSEAFGQSAAVRIEAGTNPAMLEHALRRTDLTCIGENGRALVETKFTWDRVTTQTEALYLRLILEAKTKALRH